MPFFSHLDPAPTIHAMLDHIAYIVDLVGFEHVGIGTDWPSRCRSGRSRRFAQPWAKAFGFRDEHHIDCELNLIGFDDYRDFRNITRGLVQRGVATNQSSSWAKTSSEFSVSYAMEGHEP